MSLFLNVASSARSRAIVVIGALILLGAFTVGATSAGTSTGGVITSIYTNTDAGQITYCYQWNKIWRTDLRYDSQLGTTAEQYAGVCAAAYGVRHSIPNQSLGRWVMRRQQQCRDASAGADLELNRVSG